MRVEQHRDVDRALIERVVHREQVVVHTHRDVPQLSGRDAVLQADIDEPARDAHLRGRVAVRRALDPLEEHPVALHETRLEAPTGRPATHEHDVGGRERRVLEFVEDVVLHPGFEEELRELIDMFDAPGPPRPVEEVDVVTATRERVRRTRTSR